MEKLKLEIELLLPGVPEEPDASVTRLQERLAMPRMELRQLLLNKAQTTPVTEHSGQLGIRQVVAMPLRPSSASTGREEAWIGIWKDCWRRVR